LYSRLFTCHREEIGKNAISVDEWAAIWWPPVISTLESENKTKKFYVYEVCLILFCYALRGLQLYFQEFFF